MKTSLIYGVLAAIITFIFMYLDTKLLDNPKTKTTYYKNMIFVGSLVAFGIHLIGENNFNKAIGIEDLNISVDEEIMTGSPDF